MTTTADVIHTTAIRTCVAPDCNEGGILVEFHTRPAEGVPHLTDVTLRWRCRARHAWQESYTGQDGSTTVEIEQVR